ncbi:hypothetical protein A2841_03275 [Candidatus Kaiserbacteria bacterium RIFCSPHIGHO2_01_FULL_48_10]|uniref:Uncharacterized protein n=1 Tax=Candidatus Kaiserbacteria bacterium RIFCSPHIGHO2_01_FULL_48_10 TaxID=1798476 RepID=A0A1F6C434_9BACT|nr:MAG: hypothetical protein A2841_03275 [Candidatus Kaiserbacteria bacterium RIFCSPHIGHO2_01_FULL_48_10]
MNAVEHRVFEKKKGPIGPFSGDPKHIASITISARTIRQGESVRYKGKRYFVENLYDDFKADIIFIDASRGLGKQKTRILHHVHVLLLEEWNEMG